MASTHGIPKPRGQCAQPIALLTAFGSPYSPHVSALAGRSRLPKRCRHEEPLFSYRFSRACVGLRERLIAPCSIASHAGGGGIGFGSGSRDKESFCPHAVLSANGHRLGLLLSRVSRSLRQSSVLARLIRGLVSARCKPSRVCGIYRRCANLVTYGTSIRP
jgi:hypothetical protein